MDRSWRFKCTRNYYQASTGTNTAALSVAGSPGTANESWNGSAWTELAEVNTARANIAGGQGSSKLTL